MPDRRAGAVLLMLAMLVVACSPLGDVGGGTPTPAPSATPIPTPLATPEVTPAASDAPASATPTPPATPLPAGAVSEVLELGVTGCPGGVVVDWSATTHPSFHHYIGLRSIQPDINAAYPPIAPAVDWGDSYVTDRFVTSAVDTTLIPSGTKLYYRVMAYDDRGRVLAASEVASTDDLVEVVELGALDIAPALDGGGTVVDWELFGGLGRCFSSYQVLIGPAGTTPSSTLTLVTDQATSEHVTRTLASGTGYSVRVDAIRTTILGSFVVARTDVANYTPP